MHVHNIQTINEFDRIKSNWDSVYQNDPDAHIFLSWSWLRGWLKITELDWRILAFGIDEDSPFIAFFPITYHTSRIYNLVSVRELHFAGTPLAEYTGFICLPDYERKVIEAFGHYLNKKLKWDKLKILNMLTPRYERFVNCLSEEKIRYRQLKNVTCPYIRLPDSWDEYLDKSVNSKARSNFRRAIKKIESLDGFRLVETTHDNLENQIETLLMLWQLRWGRKPEELIERYRKLFRNCFENNCLYIATIWDSSTPVAARVAFLDHQKKTFSSKFLGWDMQFRKLSPAKALNALCIKFAIENNFRIFDFTRGDEAYKSSFGTRDRFAVSTLILKRNFKTRIISIVIKFIHKTQYLIHLKSN